MSFLRSPYVPGVLLFAIAFIVGLISYQDYGMSWDETAQREIGNVNYNYIIHGDRASLDNYFNKDYGPAFEVVLIGIEKTLGIQKYRDVYLMRHLACHILFLIGCLSAYILVFRTYKNVLLASISFLIILLFPRFYAHSYFNSKDVVFLSFFFITLLAIYRAFETKRIKWYIIAGLLCGYTTCIRILGVIMPAAVGLVLLLNAIVCIRIDKQLLRPVILRIVSFALSCILATIFFWPLLWTGPVNNFIESYQRMAHFRWDGTVLLQGAYVNATDLPIQYFPLWFSLTTPILWLLLGVVGIVWFVIDFLKKPVIYLTDLPRSSFIVYFLVFFLPVCMVVILHAVIYDDWRHLYFIFAGFLMFVILAIQKLLATRLKIAVVGVSVLQLGLLAFFMIKNHPFQQLYFNELMSRSPEYIRHNYEMDYWGASTKQAFEYILEHDSASSIRIGGPDGHYAIPNNFYFLTEHQRSRIVLVGEKDKWDYFVTFFRYHPEDYEGQRTVYDFKVNNSTVLRVSKPASK
ncbi:ArnT family glycosyltransferase [Polluticoccus soli]|uniref:ArnT family glycosyltransferase n=1 Tax=Polluticoccus soli TaxID=3034150 RepID=UPI0023E22818|nr:glycosyltransferase family 39 protein [Flavipsychrobacter sp. JY13-12]